MLNKIKFLLRKLDYCAACWLWVLSFWILNQVQD